ncbi:FliH/SctL family protein [Microbacterium sp. ASV81]|uniref:FliH/SctL family protein n=1 Tax=Microbacterium capsulatum TaxID=3041921 RepID=A0ABU0XEZ3_9MICO|nr:FliH/SctL family protein [Microbacterium sp. ASV81]MDQ4213198.1 FliH/SctL family protein [Microbacterium sp. ASV81]
MSETSFTPLVVPRVGEGPVDLRAEADRARTRGFAEGYAEGRGAAREEAERERAAERERERLREEEHRRILSSALEALHAAEDALAARTAGVAALSADRIERLALHLAGTILAAELSDPARSAAHALRRALEQAPDRAWHRIVFSEGDAQTLQADPRTAELLRGIEIGTSSTIDAGGAVVEVENGAVDLRIDAALARAAAALQGADGEEATR